MTFTHCLSYVASILSSHVNFTPVYAHPTVNIHPNETADTVKKKNQYSL